MPGAGTGLGGRGETVPLGVSVSPGRGARPLPSAVTLPKGPKADRNNIDHCSGKGGLHKRAEQDVAPRVAEPTPTVVLSLSLSLCLCVGVWVCVWVWVCGCACACACACARGRVCVTPKYFNHSSNCEVQQTYGLLDISESVSVSVCCRSVLTGVCMCPGGGDYQRS